MFHCHLPKILSTRKKRKFLPSLGIPNTTPEQFTLSEESEGVYDRAGFGQQPGDGSVQLQGDIRGLGAAGGGAQQGAPRAAVTELQAASAGKIDSRMDLGGGGLRPPAQCPTPLPKFPLRL